MSKISFRIKDISVVLVILISSISFWASAQSYTSYKIGNATDTITNPFGGVCLMGGASEDDNAMIWFLQAANRGDVLVLRTSGGNGYNNYLYSSLGVSVNSVETIVFNDSSAAYDSYVQQQIQEAEAIWFAGGDQWDYISYWRNSPVDSIINLAIKQRNIVIGGTSAGMAIQGGFYFSAQNGTITSPNALSNPFDSKLTVDSISFIQNQYLSNVITDTHYDNPDRKGRHLAFLSRILIDYGIEAKGVACDEYTAICIDTMGIARVFGGFPTYDDNAYFIQTNCQLSTVAPENCSFGNPLTWNLGGEAIKVYKIKGTSSGLNTFDLNDWKTGSGGVWENWFVNNGVLFQQAGAQPNCIPLSSKFSEEEKKSILIYPNPANNRITIHLENNLFIPKSLRIINSLGQVQEHVIFNNKDVWQLDVNSYSSGLYFLILDFENYLSLTKKFMVNHTH